MASCWMPSATANSTLGTCRCRSGTRYSQVYGESLFFGGNGIAVAQSPVDINKLLSVPSSTFKEIIRPIGQVGGSLLVNQNVTLGAYYQYRWEEARLPAAGSYFSYADFLDEGGETFIIGPGLALRRGKDIDPSNSGQYGFQVKMKFGEFEYGLYAARYHDKFPQSYLRPGEGDYALVYGEGIRTFGASISTLIGETNVAAETSIRRNTPLAATGNVVVDVNGNGDGDHNPLYPVATLSTPRSRRFRYCPAMACGTVPRCSARWPTTGSPASTRTATNSIPTSPATPARCACCSPPNTSRCSPAST
nr:unknown [Pseudomonas sp. 1-7]